MKTLILNGFRSDDAVGERIESTLQTQLQARGWESESVLLCDQKIGNCAGDFFCWVRQPGMCNTDDDNRVIAAKIIQSDLVIYLTPVAFGGYSSELKRIVDHQIQNISPFFTSVNGEIHHQKRYEKYPNVLTVGWMEQSNIQAEAVFRHLVHRNAINMYAKTAVCGLVTGQPSEADLTSQTESWLDAIASASSSPVPALPTQAVSSAEATPIRKAVLLVGSPRTRKSTSASLGTYLFEQIKSRGVETEIIQIYTSINSPQKSQAMIDAVNNADLTVLAFPLYVDSLPAPVIAALEKISANRSGGNSKFAAVANCGFPEAHHNDAALAICAEFASQNGFEWLGSLALGGGEGLVHGTPLNEMSGPAIPIKKSLEIAAEALSNGQPIPQSARDLLAKPVIPNWLYKMFGGFGWKQSAKKYGVKDLSSRPY
ncbi:MAG: NAD(P)H-dependent oxidoreductase [Anaerolineales bacterium]|nr:NAD(P)H-dependent oxidoreductase [Anaerolineales bacterium]